LVVKEEVDFATESSEGYARNFSLPQTIYGENYIVNVNESVVSVKTSDGDHQISFALSNVSGVIMKGQNSIAKKNGEVILNG